VDDGLLHGDDDLHGDDALLQVELLQFHHGALLQHVLLHHPASSVR
jgi:hypothetical protein